MGAVPKPNRWIPPMRFLPGGTNSSAPRPINRPPDGEIRPAGAGASGGDVEQQLVSILRGTPFHQWPALRAQFAIIAPDSVFLAAERRVRDGWNQQDVRDQIHQALKFAGTQTLLAMSNTYGRNGDPGTLMRSAIAALEAAAELLPSAGYRSFA